MTTEAAAAFAERLKTDEAFRSRLAGAPSGEERLALARDEGFDLSADDVGAVKRALGIGELSDADLERVAGGTGSTTNFTIEVGASYASVAAVAAGVFA